MASFKKTNTKIFIKTTSELTSHNIYWKNYNVSIIVVDYFKLICISKTHGYRNINVVTF
jgi:hypothetical protein